MLNTQTKLQKLVERHSEYRVDVQASITSAEKRFREAMTKKEFGDNDIMRALRKVYAKHIKEINHVLLFKEELPELKRQRLIDKRQMHLDFLNFFSTAENAVKTIEEWVESFDISES